MKDYRVLKTTGGYSNNCGWHFTPKHYNFQYFNSYNELQLMIENDFNSKIVSYGTQPCSFQIPHIDSSKLYRYTTDALVHYYDGTFAFKEYKIASSLDDEKRDELKHKGRYIFEHTGIKLHIETDELLLPTRTENYCYFLRFFKSTQEEVKHFLKKNKWLKNEVNLYGDINRLTLPNKQKRLLKSAISHRLLGINFNEPINDESPLVWEAA